MKMEVNFYWKNPPSEMKAILNPEIKEIVMHIGKRSGAGRYCKHCGISFCKGGTSEVHSSELPWYEYCPLCGSEGTYVCSFTWTMFKQKWLLKKYYNNKEFSIIDDYDNQYTIAEFLEEELDNVFIESQAFDVFC